MYDRLKPKFNDKKQKQIILVLKSNVELCNNYYLILS